jgi:hypothetical protein
VKELKTKRQPGIMKAKLNSVAAALLLAVITTSRGQPIITSLILNGQPQAGNDSVHRYLTNSVSPGALVYFTVTLIGGQTPLSYQWQFNGTDLPGATNSTLGYPGMPPGNYTIIVTDANSATATQTANLTLDATFTKITTGPVVTSSAWTTGGTWGDYDNDGYLDLFLWQGQDGTLLHAGNQFLFQNNRDGSFSQIAGVPPVNLSPVYGTSACWGDYDNDGNLDLYVTLPVTNLLYRNLGGGNFTQITSGSIVTDSFNTYGAAWTDYDQDGFLDLFVTTLDANASKHCLLYRNNGDGTFTSVNSALVAELASSSGCAWGDYDNDGKSDLFVCSGGASTSIPNRLYHNNGDGTFTRMTSASLGGIITDLGVCKNAAWGDYDNDGYLDLFVSNGAGNNFLYHNNGGTNFARVMNMAVATEVGHNFVSGAWGDYDNDGYLDLFVTDEGLPSVSPTVVNSLYHNEGGTNFTKVTTGSPANEYSDSLGACWVDYDNDGFLDLFAARGDQRGSFLYHNNWQNNGNTNGWLTVKLVGTVSNRSAIGARVRVKATIGGRTFWQLRQITGGTGTSGHNELQANFGLSDATNVNTLRIEWPSGVVQEFENVAPRQILTLTEPPRLLAKATNGVPQFFLKGGRFIQYDIQSSTNLAAWSLIGTLTITNLSGTAEIIDPGASGSDRRFYRAVPQ